jgi:hypothetical protein
LRSVVVGRSEVVKRCEEMRRGISRVCFLQGRNRGRWKPRGRREGSDTWTRGHEGEPRAQKRLALAAAGRKTTLSRRFGVEV